MFSSTFPRRRHLRVVVRTLLTIALAVSALTATTRPAAAAAAVTRVAGADRVDTAARVATTGWDTAPQVLIATSEDYPDAVAAAALASALQAPVLLTPSATLADPVRWAIGQLEAQRATILGGPAAISTTVEDQLRAAGLEVERIAGTDRFATAADLAARVVGDGDGDTPVVALALGSRPDGRDAWPDALSAATLAGLDVPVPTLLTDQQRLPDATRGALSDLAPEKVLVLGGPEAVSDAVLTELGSMGFATERAQGATRYGTSVQVAGVAVSGVDQNGDLDAAQAVFVSGEDFPDALAAGALAARRSAPLLLVPGARLHDRVDAFLRDDATPVTSGVIVGGTRAVGDFVQQEIDAALSGQPRPQPPPPPPSCPPNSSPDCRYTYQHPIETWERLARCESGGNWAINTGNGYYGGLQFSLSSWRAVGGAGYPHQNDKWEQIHRGELLQQRQGWGAWPACSRKLGLR